MSNLVGLAITPIDQGYAPQEVFLPGSDDEEHPLCYVLTTLEIPFEEPQNKKMLLHL